MNHLRVSCAASSNSGSVRGKILQARKIQYFEPKKSKNVQRKQAVKYAQKQAKTEFLRKTGKLPQEELNKRSPKR
jgi:hypothetical protein